MIRKEVDPSRISVSPAERKLLKAYGEQLCAAYFVRRIEGFIHNLNGPLQILWLRSEQIEKEIAGLENGLAKGGQEECAAVAQRLGARVGSFVKAFGQLDDSLKFITKDVIGKCRCADELVDINDVLTDVLFFMKADMFFKHQVDLKWRPREKTTAVYGRHHLFCAIFLSIIQNGLEAMVDSKVRQLFIEVTSHNDKVMVGIENTGSGIAEEVADRLFEPFFTTKNGQVYNGETMAHEGLGLSMASVLISDFGGKIAFESGDDKTRFSVEIPAHYPTKG